MGGISSKKVWKTTMININEEFILDVFETHTFLEEEIAEQLYAQMLGWA
jgi:hypothetical protein